MSKRTLPAAPAVRPNSRVKWDLAPKALERWNPALRAEAGDDDRSISILDVIGEDYWTGDGVTSRRIAGALRQLGTGPVTVSINSPGGDMFEGLAIYNLLREHDGHVTVKVLGLAASAASVIAMAGDTVQIGRAGFLMIHDCWTFAIGNRHELRALADTMEPFDAAMADIYAARSGMDADEVMQLMDAESWLGGSKAIELGLADELLPSDQIKEGSTQSRAAAVRRVESALRNAGMPRSEAARLIHELKSGLRDAAGSGARDATERGEVDPAAFRETAALAASLVAMTRS